MRLRANPVTVNMFPFLSVLCTVIGVLVLLIVLILSTRVVESEDRFKHTARKPEAGSKEEVVLDGISAEDHRALQAQLDQLQEQFRDKLKHHQDVMRDLTSLEDLLEFKKTELLVPVAGEGGRELNAPEPVSVVPAKGFENRKLKPILIEISSTGYVVHPSGEEFPPLSEEDAEDSKSKVDPKFKRFLTMVDKNREFEYLVLLIHPNGVDNFWNIRTYLNTRHPKVNIGWEPFSREWIIVAKEQE